MTPGRFFQQSAIESCDVKKCILVLSNYNLSITGLWFKSLSFRKKQVQYLSFCFLWDNSFFLICGAAHLDWFKTMSQFVNISKKQQNHASRNIFFSPFIQLVLIRSTTQFMNDLLLSWRSVFGRLYLYNAIQQKKPAITIFPAIFMLHAIIRMLLSSALHFTALPHAHSIYTWTVSS